MFLLFYHAYKQNHKYSHSYCTSLSLQACIFHPKLFLWTLYCAHWCFFLSLHNGEFASILKYMYSVTRSSIVIIAPLSNLWPEGGLAPPNTHRIPSTQPSLICKTDRMFPEAVVESDKSNQGKLLFVSSDLSIYGGIVWCCSNHTSHRVPGEIKRREVELDPQVSPEEIMSREVELGCEIWTFFTSGCSSTAVQRTLSLWLCPARQLKQQLRGALVTVQWRGDTTLTLPLFWRQSTVSPVFFRQYPWSSLHSPIFFPSCSRP